MESTESEFQANLTHDFDLMSIDQPVKFQDAEHLDQEMEEEMVDDPLASFPTRPKAASRNTDLSLYTNMFKIKQKNKIHHVFEYQVKTEPSLPCHFSENKKKLNIILNQIKDNLIKVLKVYIFNEGFLYSSEKV